MDPVFFEIERILKSALAQSNVTEQDYVNLGEKLDSLDRLEVISTCEAALQLDLTEILIEPECWVSLDSLTASFKRKLSDVNE